MIPSFISLPIHSCLHSLIFWFSLSHKRERNFKNYICANEPINPPFKYELWIQSWWTKQTWNRMTNSNILIQNYEWKATLVYCLNDTEIMLTHKTCKSEEHILILEATLHYITHCHQRVIPSLPLQQYISCLPSSIKWPTYNDGQRPNAEPG